jgi:GxxExxY protein
METDDKPLPQEGYDLMAAAFEVHNELGHGFTEEIYQEALESELNDRGIPFLAQSEIAVFYKGRPLRKKFRPDLIVCGKIIAELKAVSALSAEHESQVLNYLKATGQPVGYLINFGRGPKLEWKRFALTRKTIPSRPDGTVDPR